ncbi:LacI family DNA-binding transcriptional regulator [Azospirillum halopraeferens]|uniref:LacI family DNA-binding transcriptional regulator n=1 Tax=Azospirillum halopraeferens TaxID=34010 RepID=UPI00041479BF|nr:LacI family DNA-binding transcriptional regulator [Azospirillum halopraeferens]
MTDETLKDARPAGRRGSEAVTMEEVARVAGVSTITVSRAISAPHKLSAATLDKVNRAIERTGYVPNLVAGALASSRSRLVAAAVPLISNPVYAETIHGFIAPVKEAGYQVLFGESGYTESEEEALIAAVLSRRPDGILLTGVRHSARCRRMLLSAAVPVVEIWDLTQTPVDVVVGFSHEAVGETVAAFAAEHGYRAFGVVSVDDERAMVRKASFARALARRGLGPLHDATFPGPASLQLGRDGLSALIRDGFADGVVFCSSDVLAQGVLTEALARGLTIPGQVSVIGFGDQSFARATFPALTTVHIDRASMGRCAARKLLDRIRGAAVPDRVVDVGFAIVERESTRRR